MMIAKRLENGNLLVPRRAEAEDGTLGDAWFEIGPDDPAYQDWLEDLEKVEARHIEDAP